MLKTTLGNTISISIKITVGEIQEKQRRQGKEHKAIFCFNLLYYMQFSSPFAFSDCAVATPFCSWFLEISTLQWWSPAIVSLPKCAVGQAIVPRIMSINNTEFSFMVGFNNLKGLSQQKWFYEKGEAERRSCCSKAIKAFQNTSYAKHQSTCWLSCTH